MRTIFLAWAITFVLTANAQKPPIKFGDVPVEDLKMTRYSQDTAAAAVVLTDFGQSTIEYNQSIGFFLSFERIRRVKVLTKDGLEHGNFSIILYRDGNTEEDLMNLKATTYNLENGKVVETPLKKDAIFREETEKNRETVKFAMPNVKAGSVFEIAYKIKSPFLFNFQDWDFQGTIPVAWSEYRANIPQYFYYKKLMQGYLPMSINESKQSQNFFNLIYHDNSNRVGRSTTEMEKVNFTENHDRWVIKDVPAFRIEPYMTTYNDYVARINFELSTIEIPGQQVKSFNSTWEDLGNDFLEESTFGGVINGNGFLKDHVTVATAGKTTPEEKLSAIYYYLKKNVAWDGLYRKYASDNLKRVWEEKKGTSADINLMLVSMLQKADFKAAPVLISTRNHGFIRIDNPVSSQFNYVIAHVTLGDKEILLDATDRTLPISLLPERCLNGQGFKVSQPSGWIAIKPTKSRSSASIELTLSPEGELKGKAGFTHDGYYGQHARNQFVKKGKNDYVKELSETQTWEITESNFENMDKLHEPVKESHNLTLNDYVQFTGDHMYINPIPYDRLDKNPFQLEKREYPVDFGSPEENLVITKITLPDGWTAEELPKTSLLRLPQNGGKYVYNVSATGNMIVVTSQLVINKALFVQNEYAALREFYALVVAKQAEQIVLKKK